MSYKKYTCLILYIDKIIIFFLELYIYIYYIFFSASGEDNNII